MTAEMGVEEVRGRISQRFAQMSPQIRQVAQFVADNPNRVAVSSIRELAALVGAKPNTVVRMAQALGFPSYEAFRRPFRDSVTRGAESFPDRARWLQALAKLNSHGQLYSQMAAASLANVEQLYSGANADDLRAVARRIVRAKTAAVLGLGVCHAPAHSFWYVGRMALDNLVLLPNPSSLPIDDLTRIGKGDVLLAMSFNPYRAEVIEAVAVARRQGATVVAITDSRAAPIAFGAEFVFVAPAQTPQIFSSMVAVTALIETLLAFIIGESDPGVIDKIKDFHRRRFDSGVYRELTGPGAPPNK